MSRDTKLFPGAVLSYSSGSENRDPYGFRVVKPGGNLLALIRSKFPELVTGFDGRLPMIINAYPASIGTFDFGVLVDSYLSYTTASRALELAHAEEMPVMVLGQCLFIADLLLRHTGQQRPMPKTILLGMGGYPTPISLENAFREICAGVGTHVSIMHGYGVAEVDAACLLSARRNEKGQSVYIKRGDDVEVAFDNGELLLSLKDGNGGYRMKDFKTGDKGQPEGEGYLVSNPERLHPQIGTMLDGWKVSDWQRRTGYLHLGKHLAVQLRKRETPTLPYEVDFFEYEKLHGHSWLFKPQWKMFHANVPIMRRTLL